MLICLKLVVIPLYLSPRCLVHGIQKSVAMTTFVCNQLGLVKKVERVND